MGKAINTGATLHAIAARLLARIPAAASLLRIGGTQVALSLAAASRPYIEYRHIPGGKPGKGTAVYRRKAAKRKAVIRARRLKHA